MKTFFNRVFASCLGVLLFFLAIFLIFMIIGLSFNSKPTVKQNSILHLELNGDFSEKEESSNDISNLFNEPPSPDLNTLVKSIASAKTDSKIKGIYVDAKLPSMGYSSANILRKALLDFKKSGKFVYSYGDYYTPLTYFISCAADSMFLSPQGMIELAGYGNITPYFKDLSDNIGVKWNIFYAGQFKSATEPLRLNKMSEPNRLQLKEFYKGLYNNISSVYIKSRKVNKDSLENFVNNFKGLFANNALKYKLVDGLKYKIDFDNFLKKKSGNDLSKSLNLTSLQSYIDAGNLKPDKYFKDKIAVIYMEGDIVNTGKEKGQISPEKFAKAFDDVINKKEIKGVVLRVNSPGGSGSASDEILAAVDRVKAAKKPVIVSMGDYAASGGYYISCHADKIVADSNSLTGSIGVFAVFPEMSKLWNEKLKVHFDSVKTHKMTLAVNSVFPMDDNSKALIQQYIEQFYDQFLGVVSTGRHMTKEDVHKIAQGRIWLGNTAKQIGLVDELGDLNKAIEICAKQAKVKDYSLTNYPKVKKNIMQEFVKTISKEQDMESKIMSYPMLKQFKPIMDVMKDESQIAQPQAKMPYLIQFR